MVYNRYIKIVFVLVILVSCGCASTLKGIAGRPSARPAEEETHERVFTDRRLSDNYHGIIILHPQCDFDSLNLPDEELRPYFEGKGCFFTEVFSRDISDTLKEYGLFEDVYIEDDIDLVEPGQLILRTSVTNPVIQSMGGGWFSGEEKWRLSFVLDGTITDATTGRLLAKFRYTPVVTLHKGMIKPAISRGGKMLAQAIAGFLRRIY